MIYFFYVFKGQTQLALSPWFIFTDLLSTSIWATSNTSDVLFTITFLGSAFNTFEYMFDILSKQWSVFLMLNSYRTVPLNILTSWSPISVVDTSLLLKGFSSVNPKFINLAWFINVYIVWDSATFSSLWPEISLLSENANQSYLV